MGASNIKKGALNRFEFPLNSKSKNSWWFIGILWHNGERWWDGLCGAGGKWPWWDCARCYLFRFDPIWCTEKSLRRTSKIETSLHLHLHCQLLHISMSNVTDWFVSAIKYKFEISATDDIWLIQRRWSTNTMWICSNERATGKRTCRNGGDQTKRIWRWNTHQWAGVNFSWFKRPKENANAIMQLLHDFDHFDMLTISILFIQTFVLDFVWLICMMNGTKIRMIF